MHAPIPGLIFSVVSTFSGCGGSCLGYRMAGGSIRLAIEWNKAAAAIYALNFPGTPLHVGDIAALSVDDALSLAGLRAGALDVFDGSPPCQGFSTVGDRHFDDPRNGLFREYVRLLRGLRPRAFVLENVSGMVRGRMKLIFAECLRELRESGYRVRARLLNTQWYGVPQSRSRVIFLGAREDLERDPTFPPGDKARIVGVREALGIMGRGGIREGWGGTTFDGIKNKQHANRLRSLALPSPTIVRARPPILMRDGQERELTLAECARLQTFPDDWKWGDRKTVALETIGNSVPPRFMAAIAAHVRNTILTPQSDLPGDASC